MSETIAKTSTQSHDAAKTPEKKNHPAPVSVSLNGEPILLEGLLGSSFGDLATDRHAALLGDPRFSHSANAVQRAQIVTGLQSSYGNAYVERLLKSRAVQAKLTVNPPDDQYEQEADKVADAVASTTLSQVQRQPEEEEKLQTKAVASPLPQAIQRQAEEEKEEVQAKADSQRQSHQTSAVLETRIQAAKGSGQPLPDSVRASLEPHFGMDFGEVRIHADAEANSLSQQFGARAFTTGQDVFFREGEYQPESEGGKSLLAHELTHVVQQAAAYVSIMPKETGKEPAAKHEGAGAAKSQPSAKESYATLLAALWEGWMKEKPREAFQLFGLQKLHSKPDYIWGLLRTNNVQLPPTSQENWAAFKAACFEAYNAYSESVAQEWQKNALKNYDRYVDWLTKAGAHPSAAKLREAIEKGIKDEAEKVVKKSGMKLGREVADIGMTVVELSRNTFWDGVQAGLNGWVLPYEPKEIDWAAVSSNSADIVIAIAGIVGMFFAGPVGLVIGGAMVATGAGAITKGILLEATAMKDDEAKATEVKKAVTGDVKTALDAVFGPSGKIFTGRDQVAEKCLSLFVIARPELKDLETPDVRKAFEDFVWQKLFRNVQRNAVEAYVRGEMERSLNKLFPRR